MSWFDRVFRRNVRYKPIGTKGKKLRYILDGVASGKDFKVLLWRGFREIVEVEYRRDGKAHFFGGERIGRQWEGIGVRIPRTFQGSDLSQTVEDLKQAFAELKVEYIIDQLNDPRTVPPREISAAESELQSMGLRVEPSPDRQEIKMSRIPGAVLPTLEESKRNAPRIMQLMQLVHGTHYPVTVLAQSKDFSK